MELKAFEYELPVHLIFGAGKAECIGKEVKKYGKKVLIVTGRGSTKRSGLLDRVEKLLEAEGLEVTAAGFQAADRILKEDDEAATDFERVADLVSGFESAYGLELLATVHWTATHEGAHSPEEAGDMIRAWTSRKASMFTQHHVDVAWQALEEGGWLTPAPAAAR